MNAKNTKKLGKYFPMFWRDAGDMSKSAMYWGFQCDDGWFDLIYKLCKDIQVIVDRDKLADFWVNTVKEKYGSLSFYTSGETEEIYNLVDEAEGRSMSICEICGKPGNNSTVHGWDKTVCPKHLKEWEERESVIKIKETK